MTSSPGFPTVSLRQSVGIDIGSKEFFSCLGQEQFDRSVKLNSPVSFANTDLGFPALIQWVKDQGAQPKDCQFVMEATGVYYESLALWLVNHGYEVSVLLPNTVVAFARSLNQKTKNDPVDSRTLARMGCERNLDSWRPPLSQYKALKQLTRHRQKLTKQRAMAKNQLHAAKKEAPASEVVIESYESIITFFTGKIKEIDQQIKKLLEAHPQMKKDYNYVLSIPSIGPVVAGVLLAETQGFHAFRNHKQLVSYAGYDVIQRQSGSSINFQERISKKGNIHIRRILFFPSINVSRYIPDFNRMYQRINEKNPKTKMKGSVALQRKLLVLAYHLVKNQQEYDSEKHK